MRNTAHGSIDNIAYYCTSKGLNEKTFTCTVRGEFQECGVDFEFKNTSVLKTGFYNFRL